MVRWLFISGFLILAAALAGGKGGAQAQGGLVFEQAPLSIETLRGTNLFMVEVARTSRQRARGLMFRHELANGQGMLFLYPREQQVFMWMKNTLVPLDMLFIGGDGRVVRVAKNEKPESTDLIPSGVPVKAVLELAAGTAERLGIRQGDRVLYPAFRSKPETP